MHKQINQCLIALIQMTSLGLVLKDPFEGGKTHSEAKLKQYEKAYRELKSQIVSQDQDFSAKQTQKLKETLESLKDISNKAASGKQECEDKIEKLKADAHVYEKKVAEYQRVYKLTNHEKEYADKIVQLEHQHLSNCKRRIEISKTVNVKEFKKLDIEERKSEAHEVFKWIIVALYQQPENKYYWPNFKEQAIEEDQGQDLIERLGKIDALNAKEEQRVKTVKFVEQFDNVKKAPQLAKYQEQINSIYEIAKIFQSSTEIGRNIKDLKKQIEKARQAFIKGDEENIQNMSNLEAIRKRIRVSEHYLHQLNEMQRLIDGKLERYNQEISLGEAYLSDLDKISSYVSEYKAPSESGEKRDTCECTIF